jgi:TP901 family phage tail tape measure protein
MSAFGTKALMAGTLVGGFLGGAIKSFSSFEKGMAEIRTMMGDATDKEVKALGDGLTDLTIKYGQKIPEALKATYDAISAGVPSDNVLDFLDSASKTAIAGVTDVGTAVDVLTTVVNSYGEHIEHLGSYADRSRAVSDMLFTTVKGGKTTMGELASAMGSVAAIAASAGVSLDELGAMYATITARGIKAAEASTAITAVISELNRAKGDQMQVFKEAGVEVDKFQQKELSLSKIMEQTLAYTKGNSAALNTLFGNKRAVIGATQILAGAMSKYNQELDAQAQKLGATDKAYSINAETMSQKFAKAWAAVTAAYREFGSAGTDAKTIIDDITEKFTNLTLYIRDNNDEVREWVNWLGKVAIALIALGVTAKVVSWITILTAAIVDLGTAGGALAVLMSKTLPAAFLKMKLAFIASPVWVGVLVVAIAGAAYEIRNLLKTIEDWDKAIDHLKRSDKELAEVNKEYISRMAEMGKLTDQQVAKLSEMTDAQAQNKRAREMMMINVIKEQEEFIEKTVAMKEAEAGRKLSIEERYQIALKSQRGEGYKAHIAELEKYAEAQISASADLNEKLASANEEERKVYEQRAEYQRNLLMESRVSYK